MESDADTGKKECLTGRSHLSTKEGERAAVRESTGAGRRRVGDGLLLTTGPRGEKLGLRALLGQREGTGMGQRKQKPRGEIESGKQNWAAERGGPSRPSGQE